MNKDKLQIGGRFTATAYSLIDGKIADKLWVAEAVAINTVLKAARNNILDTYLAGVGYTATWYASLINATGFTGIADTDTIDAHAGWAEYTGYSEVDRQTLVWGAAVDGVKALSSTVNFTIPASVTLKGLFIANSLTKGGVTGLMYCAGLFTEGDRVITGAALLSVNYQSSLTTGP